MMGKGGQRRNEGCCVVRPISHSFIISVSFFLDSRHLLACMPITSADSTGSHMVLGYRIQGSGDPRL